MSLVWIEGFEAFGASAGSGPTGLDTVYSGNTSSRTLRAGRYGGLALEIGAGAGTLIISTPGPQTIVIGFALKVTAPSGISDRVVTLLTGSAGSGSTTNGMNVRHNGSSGLTVYLGNSSLASTGAVLGNNTWHYIEFRVHVADSTSGQYELKVDGVSVLSNGGVDTSPGTGNPFTVDSVTLHGSSQQSTYDDIYICDAAGSKNNTFLGDRRVVTIFPNGAGDDSDFTPDTGTNYQRVDDNPSDGDSSYVQSDNVGDTDLYEYENISGISTIDGIQINTVARKTDTTDFDLHNVVKSDSTQSDGSASVVGSSSFLNKAHVLEDDPDTATAWTPTGVSDAQFGIKVG